MAVTETASMPQEDQHGRPEAACPGQAVEVLGEQARHIDLEIEKRVLRKIDCFLMPAMVIGKNQATRSFPFVPRSMGLC